MVNRRIFEDETQPDARVPDSTRAADEEPTVLWATWEDDLALLAPLDPLARVWDLLWDDPAFLVACASAVLVFGMAIGAGSIGFVLGFVVG